MSTGWRGRKSRSGRRRLSTDGGWATTRGRGRGGSWTGWHDMRRRVQGWTWRCCSPASPTTRESRDPAAQPNQQTWSGAWRRTRGARATARDGNGAAERQRQGGNPPFDERSVTRFCGFAREAVAPVGGVLPVLPRKAGERVQGELRRSAAEVWATVPPGGLRFVPEGFWTGREGRGEGDGCGMRSAVQLVSWDASLTEEAAVELRELLLAAGRRGEWPAVSGQVAQGVRWGEEWLVPAVPLGVATAAPTAAARMEMERQEEEAEWQAEAADKRRGTGKRAPAGGWAGKSVPRLSALMAGPWTGTRWWRGEGVGAPPDRLEAAEQRTWQHMVQWGEVPDEVHDMLAFAGVSDRRRRRLVGRVSQAQREASAQAVWHGRARHQAVGCVL